MMHIIEIVNKLCNNVHMSLKYVVLSLLNRHPHTGYEIVRSFDSAVGYFWQASHQQVYRELNALAESKQVRFKRVTQADKPDKKVYSISAAGREALQLWFESPVADRQIREPLLVKLLSVSSDNYRAMLNQLTDRICMSEQLLATYREIERQHYSSDKRRGMPAESLVLYFALRKGLYGIEAELAWLSETKKGIKRLFD